MRASESRTTRSRGWQAAEELKRRTHEALCTEVVKPDRLILRAEPQRLEEVEKWITEKARRRNK